MGAAHHKKAVTQVNVDKKNKIFSVPAFMFETNDFSRIYEGIHSLIYTMKVSVRGKRKPKTEHLTVEKKSEQNINQTLE